MTESTRRTFLRRSLASALALALPHPISASTLARPGQPLRFPPDWTGETLAVAPAKLPIWPDATTAVQAINGSVPGPTIRVRRGSEFAARIENHLAEPLVLHWHGVLAPEHMDGHPRDQIGPGRSYEVRFPIPQRSATCWYHAHTDGRTAAQAYRGVAGLFLIEDSADATLGLPAGDHDLPLVLTDKRVDARRQLVYAPTMMDTMTGYLGDVLLVNGTPDAWLSVDRGLYRFRLVNGSNARIYKIGLGDGRPFQMIANDGGLLPAPSIVTSAMLAPGQRLEILLDLSGYAVGESARLQSLRYAGGGGMGGGPTQGLEMDLLGLHVDRPTTGSGSLPRAWPPIQTHDPAKARRTRVFTLSMSGMTHTINGRSYNASRIDFQVPLGELEIWEYRNTGTEPHPMHAHGVLGQVLSRNNSTQIPPDDGGWKDTVLVSPGEIVRMLVRFDAHPGLFLHHCHNLEHEDSGMMQNFEVLAPPPLSVRIEADHVTVSWPDSGEGWRLESSESVQGPDWLPVLETPRTIGDRRTITFFGEASAHRFFRLAKT